MILKQPYDKRSAAQIVATGRHYLTVEMGFKEAPDGRIAYETRMGTVFLDDDDLLGWFSYKVCPDRSYDMMMNSIYDCLENGWTKPDLPPPTPAP